MGKPYNAGIAASNGVECALLALRGLSAPDDGLAGPQGFLATHAEGSEPEAAFAVPLPQFLLADIRHKLHACCHGTHAMIEGLRAVLADNRVGLSVCALAHPRTGLEVKFSYAWLAAMVIHGRDTASDRSFTDAVAADPALMALAAKVVVAGDPGLSDMQARGVVRLAGGRELAFAHDLAAPLPPAALAAELQAKARALLGPVADGLASQMQATDRLAARDLGRWLETEGKA
jgi:2-methylcitrate dehydratase PrpD